MSATPPSATLPHCQLATASPGQPTSPPACSRPLLLHDCLARRQREAAHEEFDTGRYRCRYVAWGRGPNLVLIPGMASDALSFVMLMARLQSRFRCISYDLPDGDQDGARLIRYRHDDLTSDLFALLDHLNVRETFVLGSSFGATIALAALSRQPRRFTRAILQGGFAHRPLTATEVFFAHWCRFFPGRLGHLPLMRRITEQNDREPFLRRDPDVWEVFLQRRCLVPLRAFANRALLLHRLDLRPLLPTIQHPVLLVCGDRDPLVGKDCEQVLQRGLPFVARAEIEECGHEPHLSHPEVLAEIVQHFLLPRV